MLILVENLFFSGVIAGIAIFIAYKQNEKTQLAVKKQYIKQIVLDRIDKEAENLLKPINKFMTLALKVNFKYFSESMASEKKIESTSEHLRDMYFEIEEAFNDVFASNIPRSTCTSVSKSSKVQQIEKEKLSIQNNLLDTFREIYNELHEYVNLERDGISDLQQQMFLKASLEDAAVISNVILYNDTYDRLELIQNKLIRSSKASYKAIDSINKKVKELRKLSSEYLILTQNFKVEYLLNS